MKLRISSALRMTAGSGVVLAMLLLVASVVMADAPADTSAKPKVAAAITLKDGNPTPSQNVPSGYVLIFNDEFNEKALDTTKWWTRIIYNDGMLDRLNDEQQHYRENNNHVMTGSELQLTARKVKDNDPKGMNYESGMIRSKLTFKYGYFEARIKMPAGKGVWPAFWMTSDANDKGHATWPPEMDVFEFVNNVKDDRPDMIHTGAVDQKNKDGTPGPWAGKRLFAADKIVKAQGIGAYYYAPFDFPEDYHVFGFLWDTDDTLTWYVDGVKLIKAHYNWVLRDGSEAPYAHILLNLAIGGKWAGRYGVDDSAFPQSLKIDYIRVYQKRGQEKTGRGTIGHDLYKAPTE